MTRNRPPQRLSLRVKATLAVVGLISFVLLLTTSMNILRMHQRMTREQHRSVETLAASLGRASELALSVRDERELGRLTKRFGSEEDIVFVAVLDPKGNVLAKSVRDADAWREFENTRRDGGSYVCGSVAVLPAEDLDEFGAGEGADAGASRLPLPTPAASQPAGARAVGSVVAGLSRRPVHQAMWQQTSLTLEVTLAATLLGAGVVFLTVGHWARRLDGLVQASHRIRTGDFDTPVGAHPGAGAGARADEIGTLAQAYDQMRQAVRRRDAQLRQLNEGLQARVEERTRDLSKALVAAEAASKAKSEFLANMSHELRTPMNGVVGMVDLLNGTPLNEQQRRYTSVAKSSADALLTIINEILDFSKIEAGRMEMDRHDFELCALVSEVTRAFAQRAQSRGLELTSFVHPEVPCPIGTDEAKVRQVLINLIGNAIKFTEKGEVVVRVTFEADSAGNSGGGANSRGNSAGNSRGGHVRFAVSDTGVGIPPDRMDRLFQSFSQVDASTTRKYGGTGLGLAISQRLVKFLGGQIGVESRVGQGSTFWFRIPVQTRSESGTCTPRCRVHSDFQGLRALVVDDNATNREVVGAQLRSWGIAAQTASSPGEALDALRQAQQSGAPLDVALLDMHMPDGDGLELARQIQADPRLARTAMLLLTSIADDIRHEDLTQAGVAACLAKPVRQSDLFDALMRTLNARPAGAKGTTPAQATSCRKAGATCDAATASCDSAVARCDSTKAPNAAAAAPAAPPPSAPRALKVLVAEDNEVNQIVIREVLLRAGHTCELVGHGRAAVEAVQKQAYDIVLMDCQMPVMDGYQATGKIRELSAQGLVQLAGRKRLPVLALTANALAGDREKCLAAGMDGHVAKPINVEQLLATITDLVAQSAPANAPPAAPAGAPALPPDHPAPTSPPPSPAAAAREETPAATIDLPSLLSRCLDDPSLAGQVLDAFARQLTQTVADLDRAHLQGDLAAVRHLAHALKGSAANASATDLSHAAAELERCARESAAIEGALARVRQDVARCVSCLPQAREAMTRRPAPTP